MTDTPSIKGRAGRRDEGSGAPLTSGTDTSHAFTHRACFRTVRIRRHHACESGVSSARAADILTSERKTMNGSAKSWNRPSSCMGWAG